CPASQVYTGSAIEPCTAKATGAGGLDVAVTPVTYGNNLSVGTASASATYGGDDNHFGSSGSANFEITKAASTTTVTVSDATYDANPHGGSASVAGVGGLSLNLTVTYTGINGTVYAASTTTPINAGQYRADASFPGDANHTSSKIGRAHV